MQNEVVLITGASGGIGRAMAHAFARQRANLILLSHSSEGLEALANQVRSYGVSISHHACDVTEKEQVEKVVSEAGAEFGSVDVLVNNAAVIGPIGLFVENDLGEWLRTIHVNLWGTTVCMQAVLPYMIKRRKGSIINLSGGGAVGPRPRFSAYSASKAAIVRLTETVAQEVKDFNIRVNAIAPGTVDTSMLEKILAAGTRAGEEFDHLVQQKKTGFTAPEKAAELALFLASPAAEGITGRLISAVWDDWASLPTKLEAFSGSSMFTLRRIDGHRFGEIR